MGFFKDLGSRVDGFLARNLPMDPDNFDFSKCGGVAVNTSTGQQLDSHERKYAQSDELMWDFGRRTAAAPENARLMEVARPSLSGRWDGQSTISLFQAATKIRHHGPAGDYIPAQWQPRGTCVGRGGSGLLNQLQCGLILAGSAATFHPVSHAFMYAMARMYYNDLHSWQDGAVGQGALLGAAKWGVGYQEEVGDIDYFKDDIAANWAYNGIPAAKLAVGSDNMVKDAALVTSCEVLADLIASGGGLTVASNVGFTMTRDSEGFCTRKGSWNHQMHIGLVTKTARGRKGFGIAQSWGKNTPSGPTLPGAPDYVFGADWDVVQSMLSQRDSMGCTVFDGWVDVNAWAKI